MREREHDDIAVKITRDTGGRGQHRRGGETNEIRRCRLRPWGCLRVHRQIRLPHFVSHDTPARPRDPEIPTARDISAVSSLFYK